MSLRPKKEKIVKPVSRSTKHNISNDLKTEYQKTGWSIESEKTLGSYTYYLLRRGNQHLEITLRESNNLITCADLAVSPKKQGIGTEAILFLKRYSDKSGKQLFLKHAITNWYDKFPWLKMRKTLDGNEHYTYNPL